MTQIFRFTKLHVSKQTSRGELMYKILTVAWYGELGCLYVILFCQVAYLGFINEEMDLAQDVFTHSAQYTWCQKHYYIRDI